MVLLLYHTKAERQNAVTMLLKHLVKELVCLDEGIFFLFLNSNKMSASLSRCNLIGLLRRDVCKL